MHTSVGPKARPDAVPALAPSLEPVAPLCRRALSRESVERYLTGRRPALERQPCDPIAAAVAGTSTARLPPLLTDAAWEPQTLDQQRVTAWGAPRPPSGLLGLDDTGLPTPGWASVGVARQEAGPLGPGAHWPVVVSAPDGADAPTRRAPGPWPLTARLYRPAGWAPAAARRRPVPGPAEGPLHTKLALALTLGEQARPWGVPCAPVVAEAGYGDQPPCRHGLAAWPCPYVVGVSRTCGGRLPAAGQAAPLWGPPRPRGRGQPRTPRPAPLSEAQAVLAGLPPERWQTLTWRAQDDVVLRQQGVAVRAPWATGGAPGSTSQP